MTPGNDDRICIISSEAEIALISLYFPNFDFKKVMTKKDYASLKKIIAIKVKQERLVPFLKYNQSHKITIGCIVEERETGKLETVSSITKGGRLAFKGKHKGAFSPLHWKLHQPAGDKNEEEKE